MSRAEPLQDLPLTQALPNLAAWTDHFRSIEIPVLGETSVALEALRENEDSADANSIGQLISGDPLMTLKVLAYASSHRGRRVVTDTETVTSTLVLMGISPFFRAFGRQPTVEDHLVRNDAALEGLNAVVRRAHRGANFTLAFAVHRMDPDAAVAHAVALLHDFTEMLLWCHAPALQMAIRDRQRADPTLRSATAQRQVLNIEVSALQAALRQTWRLPALLTRIGDPRHGESANVRSIELGARLARHTAEGWDNPAVPDDIADIAALLNLSLAATLTLVRDV